MIDLDAETIYRSLVQRVRESVSGREWGRESGRETGRDVRLVGVHTGGVWIAEKLKADLGVTAPVGVLDVSFYRDDFAHSGLKPAVRPSRIDFDVAGAHLILVDDVLFTGRTTRAALNELFDYGRPARIDLAVLIDRGGRELPIAATWVGRTIEVPREVSVALSRDDAGRLHLKLEQTHG
jgi:pyrimidine operon attenuation protein/uracil phosphoribosyltransferase